MQYFIYTLTHVILPIFIQILAGFLIQKKYKLNISSLAKIQFYIFIPALLFTKIYQNVIEVDILVRVVSVLALVFTSLFIINFILMKVFKIPTKTFATLNNATCLFNSGNLGIPLVALLFRTVPFAFAVHIIILTFQSIMTSTFGVLNVNLGNRSIKDSLKVTIRTPMFYGILIGLFFKGTGLPIWTPIWDALLIIGDGIIPLALITLGAQLAETKFSLKTPMVYLASFIRLMIAPSLAYLYVMLTGLSGIAAQVIVILAASPSAVNSALLAIEYDNEPELSSQIVFMTTLLSAITVTMWILIAMNTL